MKSFQILISIGLLLMILHACTENDPAGPGSADFDRQAMLINWADNIIIPAFTSFSAETSQLKTAAENFVSDPNQQNLETLRRTWEDTYIAFQRVSMFEIGKAMELRYRDNLNIYPTDPDEIQDNIESGSYNLELPSLNNSQGFPALDYLLYGLDDTDSGIRAFYTTHPDAAGYRAYILDLATRIDDLTLDVLTHWETIFRDDFVNNTGSGANASVDIMVNDYIYYYEKHLRAGKVGIPAGVFSGTPLSTHTEAYYRRDLSKILLLEALDTTQNFFNGEHANSSATGESLKSYLDFLQSMKQGADLSSLINNQFELARTEIQSLQNNFTEQVETDNTEMLSAYDALQLNVVNMKVDMLQALNITVDYVDADGD